MKVFVRTFGCRANHYDSELVRAMAERAGHQIVSDARDADLAVVNSCAVTAEAERDARKAVRRLHGVNPAVRTVVMGCAAALPASAHQLAALPGVSHVVPGADAATLARALGVPAVDATQAQDTVRAVLRVQDGCDEHCTFCATTLARGANRSRDPEPLVREATVLGERHPEIVITGTHIGSYGRDIGSSLGALMERLLAAVPGVRFRLSSLEATEVDARLAELFAGSAGALVPHLHAPLQSGSDRMLKRMGRHWYTAATYARAVEQLAARCPVLGLGADVMAGFPGESDADHADTVRVIESLPFTYLHVFTWSPRPGTAAPRLPEHVPLGVAHARSHELRHIGERKGKEYRARRVGQAADLVVIAAGPRREALSGDYLSVRLDTPRARGDRFSATLAAGEDGLTAA